MTHFLRYANSVSCFSRCRIHRYVAAPLLASKLKEWSKVSPIFKEETAMLPFSTVQGEQTFTLQMFLHIIFTRPAGNVLLRLLQFFNLIFSHFLGLLNSAEKRDEVVMLREE
jgi:hypothetical protein